MIILEDRILLHLQDGRRIPVDPQEIYLLEAKGGKTLIRTRHAQPLTDVRQLSELIDVFGSHGFAQIHRSWAVNLRRVREIVKRVKNPLVDVDDSLLCFGDTARSAQRAYLSAVRVVCNVMGDHGGTVTDRLRSLVWRDRELAELAAGGGASVGSR